jgi:FixJ family two-component response regulator
MSDPLTTQAQVSPPTEIVTVVDDDPALLNALTFSLEVEGYSVRAFPSGEALLADAEFPIRGALVIDYLLPGMDGLELLERLRRRGVTAPALLITTPTPQALRRAAAANVEVVGKPLIASALSEAVRDLLRRTR